MLSPVATGFVDHLWQRYHLSIYPGLFSLAILLRVGKMSTGYGFSHCLGRNGGFCVAVGTAGILTCQLKAMAVKLNRLTWVIC